MANKVIIGIVGKHYISDKKRTDSYIRDEVKQAIFDNGALAIGILSPNEELFYCENKWMQLEDKLLKSDIISQIKLCDGIILQGGITNEAYESFIAKYCYDNNIPCLGICAGQNCIAYALNGTIKSVDNPENHNKPNEEYVHYINIEYPSKFYNIVKENRIKVNSRHKNILEKYPLLQVSATDEDGYPDVVESENKKFYIGVRFHPESLYKIDTNMNNIFRYFIDQCKKNK